MNWRNLFRSRYVLMLESEIDRLRDENRGLLNSLLTRAGVQPIDHEKPIARVGNNMSRAQRQAQIEREWLKRASSENAKGS